MFTHSLIHLLLNSTEHFITKTHIDYREQSERDLGNLRERERERERERTFTHRILMKSNVITYRKHAIGLSKHCRPISNFSLFPILSVSILFYSTSSSFIFHCSL